MNLYTDIFPDPIENRLNRYTYSFMGKGWFKLVSHLNITLSLLNPCYEIIQIKQKFGRLIYFVYGIEESGYQYIFKAEQAASTVCEACGKEGHRRIVNGYYVILCDHHFYPLARNLISLEFNKPWY